MKTVAIQWPVLLIALIGVWSPDAVAAPKYVAKITTTTQAGQPVVDGLNKMAALIKERTNGEVEFRIFPNSQLAGESQTLEGMKLGSIEGGIITGSLFTQWVPEFEVIDLPFVFRDDDHAQKSCAYIQKELAPKLVSHGYHSMGCMNYGSRHLISTFPITSLADVKNKKMRVLQSPTHVRMWQLAGANPTPINAAEVYSALQTRVVDYLDNTMSNYYAFKWHEVAKHFTEIGHVSSLVFLTFSEDWLRKLPAKDVAAIQSVVDEVLPSMYAGNMAIDQESLAKAVAAGATIHKVTDRPAWQKAMSPLWEDYTKNAPARRQIIDAIVAIP